MRRHEQERNQTRTRRFGFSNAEDQNFDGDYSGSDRPNSDGNFSREGHSSGFRSIDEDRGGSGGQRRKSELLRSGKNTYEYRRPRGGDDLFRNTEYYTQDSDMQERKNARLGLGRANTSARWIGDEGTGHYGKGPKGYRRSDDRVKEDVCEALYRDPNIDASDVEVEVKEGTVILRGSVESRQIKRATEDCVDHLSGVEDVRNELTVSKKAVSLPH